MRPDLLQFKPVEQELSPLRTEMQLRKLSQRQVCASDLCEQLVDSLARLELGQKFAQTFTARRDTLEDLHHFRDLRVLKGQNKGLGTL